jgi:hypothetical protein
MRGGAMWQRRGGGDILAALRGEQKGACSVDKSAMEYLAKLPDAVPEGKVLLHTQVYVHNWVHPIPRRIGSPGFRAWLCPPDPEHLEVCYCGWAPELGKHYRVCSAPRPVFLP